MIETPIERIHNALGIIREHRHEPPTQIVVSPKFHEELKNECNDKALGDPTKMHSVQTALDW